MLASGWGQCDVCGVVAANIAGHECDPKTVENRQVAKFSAEFDLIPQTNRFRWKAFDAWTETAEGRFALYYVRWAN